MKKIILTIWHKYQIRSLEKSIKNAELNIYFNGWNGQECINHNDYCYNKIDELKLKLKKYE